MPTDMSKYPDSWGEIREKILLRAGGNIHDPRVGAECEFCGAINYAVGERDGERFYYYNPSPTVGLTYATSHGNSRRIADAESDRLGKKKYVVIVLTIAHLGDPDPMNCSDDNLAALCQRCHNVYDNPMRVRNAAKTRRAKLVDAGQMSFV